MAVPLLADVARQATRRNQQAVTWQANSAKLRILGLAKT